MGMSRGALGVLAWSAVAMIGMSVAGAIVTALLDEPYDWYAISSAVWFPLMALSAAAMIAWGRVSGRRLATVSGGVMLATIGQIAIAPLFVVEAVQVGDVLNYGLSAIGMVGYALASVALALAIARPVAWALSGVFVAASIAQEIIPYVVSLEGDGFQIGFRALALTMNAILAGLAFWARSVAVDEGDSPDGRRGFEPEAHARFLRAMTGARTYRTGLTIQVVTVVGTVVLLMMAFAARSAGLMMFIGVAALVAVFVAQIIMLIGLARFRHVPVRTGAGGAASGAFGVYVALFVTSLVVLGATFAVMDDPRRAQDITATRTETYSIVVGLVAQLLFFWAISRVARWAGDDGTRRRALSLMIWFFAVAAVTIFERTPEAAAIVGLPGILALLVLQILLIIFALGVLFKTLDALERHLEAQAWIAPFDDAPAD